jgi:hypothetical protein
MVFNIEINSIKSLVKDYKSVPEDLIADLVDICKYHSKLPINECPVNFNFDPNERKQLIAAILRLSDELDMDSNRVSLETVKIFRLSPNNAIYWWLHNLTKIIFFSDNVISIKIRLNPKDNAKFGSLVHKAFITEFKAKNRPILTILKRNSMPITINGESEVIDDNYAEELPQEIVATLKAMQEKVDPLMALAHELRTWLGAIRYEVSEPQRIDDRTIDMIATQEQSALRNRVLVRCIDGEIVESDVDTLEEILDRKIPRGWLISDKRVSQHARNRALEDEDLQVDNLSDFLRNLWRPYIDALDSIVKNDRIHELYVDPGCYKLVLDKDGQPISRDEHSSLDMYIDEWLKERGRIHISLLGEFGTGKTWFCRHYAFRQMERYLKDPTNERLPLLITLRNFAKAMTPQQLINDVLLEQYNLPFIGSAYEIFQEMNRQGKLLIILDGFDEMARQVDYQTIVDNFRELATLVDANSKVILTSRTEYFHYSKESEKILGGKEYGRRTIVLSPPKFDVLYLENFNEEQIREAINRRLGSEKGSIIADKILKTLNLSEMARKPVLVELLLAVLDEVNEDVLEDPAHVYLYATNKLLLLNIDTKRTFTTTASKLFFLCELAWEMIKTDQLRIHYTDIPSRIKNYFGNQIRDKHELDNWDFDLRSQTLLHRDAAGYYEFSHKSLTEFFVAFKFASELGCTKSIFASTYCEANGIPCKLFAEQKDIIELAKTFGLIRLKEFRMRYIFRFLMKMVDLDRISARLWNLIDQTKERTYDSVKYTGGNAATILRFLEESFDERDLSNAILGGADLRGLNLVKTNLSNCDLTFASLILSGFAKETLRFAKFDNTEMVIFAIFDEMDANYLIHRECGGSRIPHPLGWG